MSKIKVHELAKELEKQSREVIAFLQEKGIEVKAAQSSVEEDAAEMVRKAFGAAKKADVKAEVKPEAKAEAKPEAKEETKTDVKPEVKPEVKSEAKAEPSNEGKKEVQKEAPKAEEKQAAPVKKKKIIFVSNPHNSNIPGQRSQGERRQGQNNRQGNNNYNGRPGQNREVPHKIIKPLTAPSQMETSTSDFKQNSRRMDEARAELRASEKRAAEEREQAAQRAARSENPRPDNRGQNRPDNRNDNRNDNRGENRPGNRPDNRDGRDQRNDRNDRNDRNQRFGQNNQGERNNNRRPENGNRFNNQNGKGDFRNNGGDGNRNRGDFNNNRGERSNGGQDSRFKRNEKPGKSFAQDTPPVKDDKRREEEKRRISQEKDKRSKKDFMYEEDEAALKNKNKAGRFIKPEKKAEEPAEEQIKVITIPESLTIKDLADKMKLQPSAIIKKLFLQGQIVTVNSEITFEDAENIAIDYDIICEREVKVDVIEELLKEDEEKEEDLVSRPPVICVMGHVDHGKTSLLDAIRKTNVTDKEAGGITQHIGAYSVQLADGRTVTFLDTPGHEAFTAMRARGAQVTDIAIIIIAADDNVMPQTVEAINHASAAGVPIVFAINKIDKPGANPDKIREELAAMNYLVEEWGGKYQCQEISAKKGLHVEELLEKVLLEAEILELKANPKRKAIGSIIESSLDKGRGYVATVLVQSGTLHVGDVVLAGQYFGHVKAMFNERGSKMEEAGPSCPALILGLNGAPQAGDKFNVMGNEKDARALANKREQLQREQGLRTQKHITLDEIGRRIAIGNFQELNIIVKGDVDGSIEALSDSLIKLSTPEIQVNVIHKAVGQISEGDVMLAAASNAIIIGFQVRPSMSARKLAEKEEIDIRLYSIIYTAIEEIKAAMEGMLSPEFKEEITSTVEVLETFKISKVGTIAGCIVRDGKITRTSKVRVIRDGIVIYTGELGSLKRFKDDVKEVAKGFECGLNINNYNDIQTGDFIESFEEVAVKKTL